ncbi:prephenate dehydrogenase [Capnocytophaga catalasegens]|uniref:Prephenate dehydrogenase n=1 Tax=Capnocytophaga catalasegens TaxID=1004260 RepID=A0AAV5AXH7_9FLAO|nr:prephenate dehydrogenase [Capnocytophaga catalasegens]GIZ14297.1 prephenate dehydrogenase [Capnocytophaga catalasegens]GJM51294.1 prephenate dehydrogenase [Capnocytophaga catalasegens]GJM53289.1 prephenate dehydrogenase [Capnocytophaga catalasegens]
MKKIAFVGVGLIGGSFALEIKLLYPQAQLIGIDKNKENIQEALDLKIIDKKGTIDDVACADMVLISIPVDNIPEVLSDILARVKEQTLVIDMGSTKAEICQSVENHPKRNQFLAAHPIAGTEYSGAKSAFRGLFAGKTMIVCEVEKTSFALQEKALDLFQKIGMRIRYMNPVMHDKHIAYVSHLSHVISYMLGKTVMEKEASEKDIFDMAGSGFASTVRLAKSSASMWVPIFKQNRNYLLECLKEYIENLHQFEQLLAAENYSRIFDQIDQINQIKDILNGKNIQIK